MPNSSPNSQGKPEKNWDFTLDDFERAFEESESQERKRLDKLPKKFKPGEGVEERPADDDKIAP